MEQLFPDNLKILNQDKTNITPFKGENIHSYLLQGELMEEKNFAYLTRQDIADFASISTESAIKFLKEFEKGKIIKLKGKNIEITNLEKLESISKNG